MFASSMDTVRDTARNAGTLLIPMRFVWPYGGRSVFLSGSFTRWSELVPMTPMEGCPTVFQAIYSLTPGYHQYKFFVDGEWRHDEQQTCISGEYGVVNTVLLATEPSYAAPLANPEMAPGSSMDVDNDAVRRLVRINDGRLSEAVHSISEADLQCSRHRISAFLSTHTVYELLPESGKVVALDIDLPVKQAFHILHEQGIPTAPLWDFSKGQFVGVLSASDFILILKELGKRGSNLTEEELETHTISAWKEGKAYLNGRVDGQGRFLSRQFIHAEPFDNLKDVALKILQNQVATVPIIHSSAEDGSFPQLLHLSSLSGILKSQVSSIPIVDDNDSLLDVYCRSDITALAKDRAYTHINLDEMTIHQALQLGQDSFSLYEPRSQRCQMCLRSDSLHKVMDRLANPGVRRLVIVEAGSKRVEGIISLSDVFKFLLG
ncbi:sucrose nonfermenting 4-like protein isoform X2 [Cucurbita maxima]|uniref:Sucrose nonfermenting 4-like protein isoform X2 n=2 Tax=Cucurbita TaxID=3660 RepID=A0A6J1KZG4_CUCMA|nr:sucrose nonfermenting 4-like protein isoform X2 [Cucurbita moschata]XP_023006180.1 sucrose nonfermenting 4-like protein isoform X2 [Cucurbita maxima]